MAYAAWPWGEAPGDARTRLRLPGKALAQRSSGGSCADPLGRTLLPASHRLFARSPLQPGWRCLAPRLPPTRVPLPPGWQHRSRGKGLRRAPGARGVPEPWLWLWQVRDVPRHESQVQERGLGVRSASQHHCCLLNLHLAFVVLGAVGEKPPQHGWAPSRLGKGGEAPAQCKGRMRLQEKARWDPGTGCRWTGNRPGCPGSGGITQPCLVIEK